ncbi:MAG: tyrosine-type recombinase/integrase, partial [Pseudomonadota bacterium]
QHRGGPLTESYASQKLGLWARRAGVNPALTLNDARGTAATNLIRAGVKLDKMAVCMGWSIKHAAAVIEHYVSVDRSCADEVLAILEAHRAKGEQKRLL